ncbi:hypothetical protein [Ammoniphilus resinae]|uniref:Uncharacterized protein n=1 Tax=Ammoniphilus resinae TaxID=861532 RepID=A0ABS4GMG6_9BACL|nr:hypothetical protein [Ammoniphilus resinae]MBP1931468.1 hypothetical protein [Ammoniphilus resinae]
MLWSEVREVYPDQYVVLQALSFHIKDNKKVVDEVAVIKTIDSARDATRELVRSSGDRFVYHTSKEKIEIEIRPTNGLRIRGLQ